MHRVALGVLLLFYLSSIAGLLMSVIPSLKSWAFFAAPFYKQTALDSVQPASGRQAQVILPLNPRAPELLYKVAQKGRKFGLDHALVMVGTRERFLLTVLIKITTCLIYNIY